MHHWKVKRVSSIFIMVECWFWPLRGVLYRKWRRHSIERQWLSVCSGDICCWFQPLRSWINAVSMVGNSGMQIWVAGGYSRPIVMWLIDSLTAILNRSVAEKFRLSLTVRKLFDLLVLAGYTVQGHKFQGIQGIIASKHFSWQFDSRKASSYIRPRHLSHQSWLSVERSRPSYKENWYLSLHN